VELSMTLAEPLRARVLEDDGTRLRFRHDLICEAEGQGGQALSTMAGLWDWCASSGLVLELPAIGADLVRLAAEVTRRRDA
jgi:hypothetical protein